MQCQKDFDADSASYKKSIFYIKEIIVVKQASHTVVDELIQLKRNRRELRYCRCNKGCLG